MSTAIDKVNGHAVTAEPRFDPVALAEAAAIRSRSEAETEARLTLARAEAKAVEVKAAEEAEKQRIANERAALRFEREQAEQRAKIAEANRKREESERLAAEADAKAEAEQQAEAMAAAEIAEADEKWRKYAIRFAVVCGIVALPVQIAAFWNPEAWWLVAAPVMLEGGSWVVQRGAAAAVANRRPLWHYRSIAWLLAFVAAGINLWHGLAAFDPATAGATAFASLAGPGVWDLHEHGRIRKRDGVLSRRERKAQERAEWRAAAEKARTEATARAEKEAAEKAAAEAAQQLAVDRAKYFEKVWDHAVMLAADLGETTVTEAIWKRAKRDIEGTDPGESVDIIRGRNIAARRVEAARSEAPGGTPSKVTSTQRASQMPPIKKPRVYKPPTRRGRRHAGDTPKYVEAARKQAAITAKNAALEEQK
ncbi:hypothetical protein ACFWDI_28260 [Streptomyces sp. NPDC060064]|uniref:hypothetical protein n=1 Tax=Streptomyces sp. NPDC060064 TaxID=3347049 RepID=UPI0036B9BA5B